MKKHLLLTFIIIFTVISTENSMAFEIFNTKFQKPDRQAKKSDKTVTKKTPMVEEPDISVAETNGIYVIKLNHKKLKGELKPHYVVNLTTNNEVYNQTGARLVVNAGFFDPKNHQTVSFLTQDGKQILDPHNNKNLMNNKHLQPYMDKILNRSEFRVLKSQTTGEIKYDITPHNTPCPDGYEILHSIQGGPGLVPDLRLDEEFFVLTDKSGKIISQSASSLAKYARTLMAIKDNDVYFIIATNSHPISLPEASDMLKEAGMDKAMAFDGGGSVSVDFKDNDLHIISDKDQSARSLKSFWIVTDTPKESVQEKETDKKNPEKVFLPGLLKRK